MDIEITPQNDDFMIIQSLVAPAPAVVQQPPAEGGAQNQPAAVAAALPKYKLVINNIALQVKTVVYLRLIRLLGNLDRFDGWTLSGVKH
jgi:hypothetical protein